MEFALWDMLRERFVGGELSPPATWWLQGGRYSILRQASPPRPNCPCLRGQEPVGLRQY